MKKTMKELTIMLLMTLSAYLSYYFTSDIYFSKGLLAAQEKYKNIQTGEVIGIKSLDIINDGSKNQAFGMSNFKDNIKIEVCKHGADWNHPGCNEK